MLESITEEFESLVPGQDQGAQGRNFQGQGIPGATDPNPGGGR